MDTITFDDFLRVDMRVGRILRAEPFPKARKPAYKLWIDFGPELGEKRSSAQITDFYEPEALAGRLVVAVVNFPPRQIADFMSEVLVMGVDASTGADCTEGGTEGGTGVALLAPDRAAVPGTRVY